MTQDLLERDRQAHEAGPVLRVIPGGQRHRFGKAAWASVIALALAAVATTRRWRHAVQGGDGGRRLFPDRDRPG
jgi:hypothetical protein